VRRVRVPGDKSVTQRALIFASLASGESRLRGLLLGEDPQATARALRDLGVDIPPLVGNGTEVRIQGVGLRGLQEPKDVLDFENSGTGARLMLGVLAGQPMTVTVTGDASLRVRPMRRVTTPLSKMGAVFRDMDGPDRLPLEVTGGPLDAIDYDSPVASAQVKSAVLLAGLVGDAFVFVSEPHRSRDHTERMLSTCGVPVISREVDGLWRVELRAPPEWIAPLDLEIPGDFSSSAFFLALAILDGVEGGLEIDHVGMNPTRRGLLDVLNRMGADVGVDPFDEDGGEPVSSLRALPSQLVATSVGGDEVPAMIDEFPVLAILAARAEGVTSITGASELRHKESDRIKVLAENLRAVGVKAEELSDGLEIEGGDHPLEGRVSSHNDHRIAMAFGVLGALEGNQIEIDGADVADVSFPNFWGFLRDLANP
jgi:3-phosphoshikimate 1-carboxyvinyltransferase